MKTRFYADGAALVISLLILLVMTILGVSALSSSHMQEKMAGNVNTQAIAFKAASSGVPNALGFANTEFEARPCSRDEDPWTGGYGTETTFSFMESDDTSSAYGFSANFALRPDCRESSSLVEVEDDPEFQIPVQKYVTSRGQVASGSDVISQREVELRIDSQRTDGLSAIRYEGQADVTFGAPSSQQFIVKGDGGPAISATTEQNSEKIAGEIKAKNVANYQGGVARSDYNPPFNSAWELARFALEIRAFMDFHNFRESGREFPDTSECNIGSSSGMELDEDMPRFRLIEGPFTVSGSTDFDGIFYVAGDLDMSGTPRGTGMIIVEGDVAWSGKAEYRGFVMGLGGRFDIDGGGSGETRGSIFAANIELTDLVSTAYIDLLDDWEKSDGTSLPAYDCLGGCSNAVENDFLWEEVVNRIYEWTGPTDVDPPTTTLQDLREDLAASPVGTSNIDLSEYAVLYDNSFDLGFGPVNSDLSGGGKHTVNYDCSLMDQQRRVLAACGKLPGEENFPFDEDSEPDSLGFVRDGLADPWIDQLCNTPGGGAPIQAIRSWRDNLGWRNFVQDLDSS
ncbi:MAG: hypothetical protein KGY49_04550 [Wenzhouxiangellaceae bacterium]|nr:hypothetical protein [Wenzhouxiangellaceae bacterium]